MRRIFSLFFVIICFSVQAQKTIEGITFPASIQAGNKLTLNGVGLREKFFIDLYVAGYYTQSKISTGDNAMNKDESMAIRIVIVSDKITRAKFISAVDEGFLNATQQKTQPIASKITDFKSCFTSEIKVGDIITIQYQKSVGSQILINGKLIKTIPGLDFKKALFGIWFCIEPADGALKNGMLGLE